MEDANAKDSCTKAPLEEIGGSDAPNAKGVRSFVARMLLHQCRSRQTTAAVKFGIRKLCSLEKRREPAFRDSKVQGEPPARPPQCQCYD